MAALSDLVRRERPDVLHFEWIVLPLLDRLFLPRLARLAPLVLTVHNSVPWHGTSTSALMIRGHDEALRGFDHYIPHTENIRDHLLRQGVPAARMDLLPHPAVRLPRVPEAAAGPGGAGPAPPSRSSSSAASSPTRASTSWSAPGSSWPGAGGATSGSRSPASRSSTWRRSRPRWQRPGPPALFDFEPATCPSHAGRELEGADIVVFPYREIDASGAFACASQFGKPIVASELGVFAEAPVRDHLRWCRPRTRERCRGTLETLIDDPAARGRWAARSEASRASCTPGSASRRLPGALPAPSRGAGRPRLPPSSQPARRRSISAQRWW